MNKRQRQLIKLLTSYSQSAWEIDAVHKRCCVYYGEERALEESRDVIDFATQMNIGLLESFHLQVEINEEVSGLAIKRSES